MQVTDVIAALLARSGMSARAASRALGRASTWASNSIGRTPKLDTLAEVADLAGVDVVLRDRATGEDVATIEPPEPR